MCQLRLLLLLLALHAPHTSAQLSLYVPDTDPQPLSAVELGVGPDGRTTWEILPGAATGSWATEEDSFPTLTLAEGPNDAVLTGAPDLHFAVSCTFLPGTALLAACTNLADGGPGWEEAATPLAVQTGAPLSGAGAETGAGTGGGSRAGTGAGAGAGTGTGTTTANASPISPNGAVSGSPVVPSNTSAPKGSGARVRAARGGGWAWAAAGVACCVGLGVGWGAGVV